MALEAWLHELHDAAGTLAASEPDRLVMAADEMIRRRRAGVSPDPGCPFPEPPAGFPLPEALLAISALVSECRPGRLQSGRFFTPTAIAGPLLQRAGWQSGMALLDPACGGGAFLLAAARQIQAKDPRSRLAALRESLHGIEKEPCMAALCRLVLTAWVLEPRGMPEPPGIREALESNIVCDDTLRGRAFGGRFFDIVAGNPPFIGTRRGRIPRAEIQEYKRRYRTAKGQFDLYSLFVEDSLSRLSDGGTLAFVMPRPFLTNDSAAPLRSLLYQYGGQCEITDLGRPFKAAVETVELIVRKGAGVGPNEISSFPGLLLSGNNCGAARLIQRLSEAMPSLGDLTDSWRGLECGRHDTAISQSPPCLPLLRGRNVRKYRISPVECFFRPRPGLPVPRYNPPPGKLLVRRVSPDLVAAFDESGSLALNTLYYVIPRPGIDPWPILAVINSSWAGLWFKTAFAFNESLFPYVRLSQLRKLPCCPPGHRLLPALGELARNRTVERSEAICMQIEREIDDIVMQIFEIGDCHN